MKTYCLRLNSAIVIALVLMPFASLARQNSPPRYRLTIKDVPSARQFKLTLTSLDDRPICLHIQQWPNQRGEVHFGASWVVLHSAGGLYRARDTNSGRCVGPKCIIHIAPKGVLRGIISYSVFGSAVDVIALKNRRLQVDVQPRLCTAPEFQVR